MPHTTFRRVALILAIAAAPFVRADEPKAVLRVYDIRSLIESPLKAPRPRLGLAARWGDRYERVFPDEEEHLDGYAVLELVRHHVSRGNWEHEKAIELKHGRLRIKNVPEVHRQVRFLLSRLETAVLGPITLELTEYEGSSAGVAGLVTGEMKGWKQVRRRVVVTRDAHAAVSNRTTSGQYWRRLDLVDKKIVRLRDGYRVGRLIAVTPLRSPDGKHLRIHLRAEVAQLDGAPDKFAAGKVTLEQPRLRVNHVASSVVIPAFGSGLVGAWREGGQLRALVVRHRPNARRAGDPFEGKALPPIRVLSMRTRCDEIPTYKTPLPHVNDSYSTGGGWNSGRDPMERVIESLKKADEEAWEDYDAVVSSADQLLIVTHRKAATLAAVQKWCARPQPATVTTRIRVIEGLDPKRLAEVEALLARADSGVRCTDDLLQRGLVGQTVGGAAFLEQPFVKELEKWRGVVLPSVETLRHGTCVRVSARPVGDRVSVRLVLEHRRATLARRVVARDHAVQVVSQDVLDGVHDVLVTPGTPRLVGLPGGRLLLLQAWVGGRP